MYGRKVLRSKTDYSIGRFESIMDVNKILTELRHEREQLEDAIYALERLARGRGKRRGRPPAWMKDAQERRKVRDTDGD